MRGLRYRTVPSRRMTFLRILSFPWLSDTDATARSAARGECQGRSALSSLFLLKKRASAPPRGKTEGRCSTLLLSFTDAVRESRSVSFICSECTFGDGVVLGRRNVTGILDAVWSSVTNCFTLFFLATCKYFLWISQIVRLCLGFLMPEKR